MLGIVTVVIVVEQSKKKYIQGLTWTRSQAVLSPRRDLSHDKQRMKLETNHVFLMCSFRIQWQAKSRLCLSSCLCFIQSQHFNFTWMRHVRQQDLCIAPESTGKGFTLQSCDNTKAELRWFHKSSNSALVG